MSDPSRFRKRTETILALKANGLTHQQIADQLNCSTKTVERHTAKVKGALQVVNDLNARASQYVEKIYPIEKRIDRIAELAKDADNDSVCLAAVGRLDDYNEYVSAKEKARTRTADPVAPQAMFMLPANAHVSVTVSTTSNKDAITQHAEDVRDVTPKPLG